MDQPDTSDNFNIPPSPEGYEDIQRIKVNNIIGFTFFFAVLAATFLYLLEAIPIVESYLVDPIKLYFGGCSNCALLILYLLILIPTIIVHDLVHYVTARLMGYNAQIRWNIRNPNVIIPGEFVKRYEAILLLLSPLIVISAICSLLIYAELHPFIRLSAILVFPLNLFISYSDLAKTYLFIKFPEGTLSYTPEDLEIQDIYICKPESDAST